MLRIVVTEYNGQPPEQPIAAEFDELGGKIGRGNDSTLVLPDIQRFISRTHALVFFRAGTYFLRDLGSASPVVVNQRQLGTGQEAPIGDGDQIRIAGYSLQVAEFRSKNVPMDGAVPGTSGRAEDDPLAAFGAGASQSDPFANLIPSPQPVRAAGAPMPSPPQAQARWPDADRSPPPAKPAPSRASSSQIPDDFDPFGEPAPASSEEPAELPDGLDLGLGGTGPSQKIDDLFGLAPGDDHDPFKSDTPMAETFQTGGSSVSLDPLVAMGMAPAAKPAAQSERDNTPELYGSYRMPRPNVDSPVPRPQEPRASPAINRDRDFGAMPAEVRDVPASEEDAPHGGFEAAPPPSPVSPPAVNAIDGGSADALLHAFLAGAGVPEIHIPGGMTPQLMNILGQLFRENTQGTLDLLLARAATKRQLRAEMTTIVTHENNPLKFSPSVEAALTHLLAPQGRGFMTPLRALRDTYNDLRSHEVGFLAGMRAALAGVLARFSPAQLENRLTRKTVLDSLLPMNRRAKLWALFEELYADISEEAEDNFHNLFGREFMRAYEDQIAKLERDERKSKG